MIKGDNVKNQSNIANIHVIASEKERGGEVLLIEVVRVKVYNNVVNKKGVAL